MIFALSSELQRFGSCYLAYNCLVYEMIHGSSRLKELISCYFIGAYSLNY